MGVVARESVAGDFWVLPTLCFKAAFLWYLVGKESVGKEFVLLEQGHTGPCMRVALLIYLPCRLTEGRLHFLFVSLSSALIPGPCTAPGT